MYIYIYICIYTYICIYIYIYIYIHINIFKTEKSNVEQILITEKQFTVKNIIIIGRIYFVEMSLLAISVTLCFSFISN